MSTATPHHVFAYEEYLARERETSMKHEFLDGQVFAMPGGSPEHARLIAEVAFLLRGMIDSAQCRVFTSELKIRVEATGLATYPDVAIVCGDVALDQEDKNAVTNPKVLVEVLSPSTEAYDRGYRRIPTLDAYIYWLDNSLNVWKFTNANLTVISSTESRREAKPYRSLASAGQSRSIRSISRACKRPRASTHMAASSRLAPGLVRSGGSMLRRPVPHD